MVNDISKYKTDEYKNAEEAENKQEEELKNAAEDFLDNHEIENENIREAYIDAFVNENKKYLRNDVISKYRYKMTTNMYVLYASYIGDDEMFKDIRILDNDFTGSKNAIIDVNAIAGNYIEGNNFADTTILNLLKGKRSSLPSQTKHLKLEGASIVVQNQEEQEEIQNLYGLSSNTKFVSQKENDEAYLNRVVDELIKSPLTRKLAK